MVKPYFFRIKIKKKKFIFLCGIYLISWKIKKKDSFSVGVPTVVNERHILVDGRLFSLFRLVPTRVSMAVCLVFVGG